MNCIADLLAMKGRCFLWPGDLLILLLFVKKGLELYIYEFSAVCCPAGNWTKAFISYDLRLPGLGLLRLGESTGLSRARPRV